MPEAPNIERRLTAILAADVVGYSRLMGEDPEATVEAITSCREIFARDISGKGGHGEIAFDRTRREIHRARVDDRRVAGSRRREGDRSHHR